MTQLELVKHDKGNGISTMSRNVVAVSTSYSALVDYCNETYGSEISEVGCDKQSYFTIHDSPIVIVPSKF